MPVPRRLHRYSFQDYLAVEEAGTIKHEYLDGEIYAMAGGTPLHAALSAAVSAALHGRLPAGCRVYSSDLRVRVARTGLACYPDVTVIGGPVVTDPENRDTALNPRVVVEVLSPSTREFDLGEKLEHYQQIPTLEAVVYVWQDRRRIEVEQRGTGGTWPAQGVHDGHDEIESQATQATDLAADGQTVHIAALAASLDVDAIYATAGYRGVTP